MDMPKSQNHYCPKCKKHTSHEVKRVSVSKKKRGMAQGQRRFKRKMKGFGSFPKSNPKGREKPTRKLDLTYKCKICKKSQNIGKGFRVSKFEITK
ncbi:MAG: 50S ribosomal protein L44e [Nanoarchaeota archaeon]|nr:50S ribosomal protein L44e [Nanoarchaeota archaeon]